MPISEPVATALNATTYTAISAPAGYNLGDKFFPISAYTSDGTAFYISNVSAPAADKAIPADKAYNDDNMTVNSSGVMFYAKASAGTPDLLVLFGRPQ